MKRFFDFIFSIVLLIIFIVPIIAIAIAIKLTSQGHVLYWSDRVGKNNVILVSDIHIYYYNDCCYICKV